MKNLHIKILITGLLLLIFAMPAFAEQPAGGDWRGKRYSTGERGMKHFNKKYPAYGGYCPKRHADRYGARQPVGSLAEAKERLYGFYGITPDRISNIEEYRHVFIAEITDPEGNPVETVAIDRRTGRIRSVR